MKVKDLVENIDARVLGDENTEVSGLYHNSKEVQPDSLFFAINGTKQDGKDFITEAVANGAVAVVTDKECGISGVTEVVTDDVRQAMSRMACKFYDDPSRKMTIIGVTGTNGKTTTTFMLSSVLTSAGYKVGIIGTNGIYIEGKKIDANLTTPDPIYLNKTLDEFYKNGVQVVCMEVSAHALELEKTKGIMTDIALFTNLTQDHLDFFQNMSNYGAAKAKLFTSAMSKIAVINIDDDFGKELYQNCQIEALCYGRKASKNSAEFPDIIATNETHNTSSQSFDLICGSGKRRINLKLNGGFNISNALGVVGAALVMGVDLDTIKEGLEKLERVDGRFNCYDVGGVRVVIDYAHTPDGLENILSAAREITSGRVLSVFGCGGNRDKAKRPIMGEISSRLADVTIVTTDNPRFEDPKNIAADVLKGADGTVFVELDRRKAIIEALKMAAPGDTVVIAGKGAENYIDAMGVKSPYEDRLVVEEFLKNS